MTAQNLSAVNLVFLLTKLCHRLQKIEEQILIMCLTYKLSK